MQPREKKLLMLVAACAVPVLSWLLWQGVSGMMSSSDGPIAQAQKKVQEAEMTLLKYRRAQKQLEVLKTRSLPKEREVASSVYHHWLTDQVAKAKLTNNVNVQVQQAQASEKGNFVKYPFTLTANGSLDQITTFLHLFYSANHLHKITQLSLKPTSDMKMIAFRATIEAVSMGDVPNNKGLNAEPGARMKEKDLASYKKAIVERNPFGPYVPPPPPREERTVRVEAPKEPKVDQTPPPAPVFDIARFAKVTFAANTAKGGEAFVTVQTTGERLELKVGDPINVGSVKGTVRKITNDGLEFFLDGKNKFVKVGHSLTEAEAGPQVPVVSTPTEPTIED